MEVSRLTRDGTAEPVSRDQIFRHARGQGNIIFPVQLTTSRIGNLTRLIHTLAICDDHTYIHTYPVIYVVANPVRGHKEVPRSTGHIMVTTRYSDQQGSKSRQKNMRLYKRWHRPITKRFIKPPLLHIKSAASIGSDCCRLPTTSVLSNKSDKYVPSSFDQQFQVSQGHIVQK